MPDTELDALGEMFSDGLRKAWSIDNQMGVVGQQYSKGQADQLWESMAALGWPALIADEAYGGLGMGLNAAVRLYSALGAALAPAGIVGNLMATDLVASAGSAEQQEALLPGLADGSLRAGMAIDNRVLTLEKHRLDGASPLLVGDADANLIIFPATHGDRNGWLVIEPRRDGVKVDQWSSTDATRTFLQATFDETAIRPADWIQPLEFQRTANRLLRHACLALAADALGCGETALATAVEYLKARQQFGRVIGSFQALKHRVADHKTALFGAKHLLHRCAQDDDMADDALLNALSAKVFVTRSVAEVARDCIQLFGGIGFTSEHSAHLYLNRAKLTEALLGGNAAALDLAAHLMTAAR